MSQLVLFANVFAFIFGGIGILVTLFLGIQHRKAVIWTYFILQVSILTYIAYIFTVEFLQIPETPDFTNSRVLHIIRSLDIVLFPLFFHSIFMTVHRVPKNLGFLALALIAVGLTVSPVFYSREASSFGWGYMTVNILEFGSMVYVFVLGLFNMKNINTGKVRPVLIVFSIIVIIQVVLLFGVEYLKWFGDLKSPLLKETFVDPVIYFLWSLVFLWAIGDIIKLKALDQCIFDNKPEVKNNSINLTEREMEISNLLIEGKRNKDISDELGISEFTVKTHVRNIYQKTGVKNRVGLSKYLTENNGKPLPGNEV